MHNSSEIIVYGYVYGEPKTPSLKHPAFVTFSLSVTEKYKDKVTNEDKKTVTWYECQTSKDWLSERVIKHVKQGMGLAVRGVPKCDAYLDKDGTPKANIKINMNDLKILAYPKNDGNSTEQPSGKESPNEIVLDDEIPF